MSIKWGDVDIMVTALSNEIRLCKAKPVKGGKEGADSFPLWLHRPTAAAEGREQDRDLHRI